MSYFRKRLERDCSEESGSEINWKERLLSKILKLRKDCTEKKRGEEGVCFTNSKIIELQNVVIYRCLKKS